MNSTSHRRYVIDVFQTYSHNKDVAIGRIQKNYQFFSVRVLSMWDKLQYTCFVTFPVCLLHTQLNSTQLSSAQLSSAQLSSTRFLPTLHYRSLKSIFLLNGKFLCVFGIPEHKVTSPIGTPVGLISPLYIIENFCITFSVLGRSIFKWNALLIINLQRKWNQTLKRCNKILINI